MIWRIEDSKNRQLLEFFVESLFHITCKFFQLSYLSFDINLFQHFIFSIFYFYFRNSRNGALCTFKRSLIFKFKSSAHLKFYCSKFWPSSFHYIWKSKKNVLPLTESLDLNRCHTSPRDCHVLNLLVSLFAIKKNTRSIYTCRRWHSPQYYPTRYSAMLLVPLILNSYIVKILFQRTNMPGSIIVSTLFTVSTKQLSKSSQSLRKDHRAYICTYIINNEEKRRKKRIKKCFCYKCDVLSLRQNHRFRGADFIFAYVTRGTNLK